MELRNYISPLLRTTHRARKIIARYLADETHVFGNIDPCLMTRPIRAQLS